MLDGNVWGFLYTCNFLITEKQKYEIKQNLPLWISISQVYYKQIFKCSNPPLVGHASQQISAHFGKAVSEKKIFRNWPI